MILGLRFSQVCLHFRLRFWQRGGKFKSLISLLIIDSPTLNLYKCNLHDIYNQRRNLVSLSSSATVFFIFTVNFYKSFDTSCDNFRVAYWHTQPVHLISPSLYPPDTLVRYFFPLTQWETSLLLPVTYVWHYYQAVWYSPTPALQFSIVSNGRRMWGGWEGVIRCTPTPALQFSICRRPVQSPLLVTLVRPLTLTCICSAHQLPIVLDMLLALFIL